MSIECYNFAFLWAPNTLADFQGFHLNDIVTHSIRNCMNDTVSIFVKELYILKSRMYNSESTIYAYFPGRYKG